MRCRGRNADGSVCQSPEALIGASGYCRVHDPNLKAEVREQGRRGAKTTNRRLRKSLSRDDLGPLRTPEDAQRWLIEIACAVGEGTITAAAGSTMRGAVTDWLRAEDLRLRKEDLAKWIAQVADLKQELAAR